MSRKVKLTSNLKPWATYTAEQAGVSLPTVKTILGDRRKTTTRTAGLIARALGVSVRELLKEGDYAEKDGVTL